jgi:hypothetical protein
VRAVLAGLALIVMVAAGCSGGSSTAHITVSCHGPANCATAQFEQLTAECSDKAVHKVDILVHDSDPNSSIDGFETTRPCPPR